MGRIARLSDALASQIAAGEVVERPASALKELLENSLDAGATRCDVEIEGGGVTRLRVRDDGCGMDRVDAELAVQRHATSKLVTFEDLNQLPTYGFRGEALPSIASVSRFTLETRSREHEAGTRVVVEGGAPPVVSDVGMPGGTQIDVRDLFFNVPARRKFLRSSGTESGHVGEVVEAAALSSPHVTFTLMRDGRKAREWLRARDRSERVSDVFGDESLVSCRGERGPLLVEAYLGRPERARAGAASLKLFCNQRPVRDRAVLATVAQAYGSVLERGRYPRGVVYLELPPQLVDINVHPQKAEVRFADGRAVTDALYDIISAQLARAFSLPNPSGSRWNRGRSEPSWVGRGAAPGSGVVPAGSGQTSSPERPFAETDVSTSPESPAADAGRPSEVSPRRGPVAEGAEVDVPAVGGGAFPTAAWRAALSATPVARADGSLGGVPLGSPPAKQQSFMHVHEAPNSPPLAVRAPETESDVSWAALRFVAQVRGTYLICEGNGGLFVLDQHAAAERVNFHKLKQQYAASAMPCQALLFPATLEVDAEQTELIEQRQEEISRLGFEVRVHGENTVSVHRVPRLLQRDSTERLFRELLAELGRVGRGFSYALDAALSTIACHGSIRAGDPVNEQQASALLKSLGEVDFAGHCPHGRPIVMFTSWSELERKVGRR